MHGASPLPFPKQLYDLPSGHTLHFDVCAVPRTTVSFLGTLTSLPEVRTRLTVSIPNEDKLVRAVYPSKYGYSLVTAGSHIQKDGKCTMDLAPVRS